MSCAGGVAVVCHGEIEAELRVRGSESVELGGV